MAGLDPAIHVYPPAHSRRKSRFHLAITRRFSRVDGRVKPGHDENGRTGPSHGYPTGFKIVSRMLRYSARGWPTGTPFFLSSASYMS